MGDNDFFSWRRDMLHQFQSVTIGEGVYSLLQREAEALEYDYYTLCARHPVPFTHPRVTFQSAHPRAWISHYQVENYFVIDPILRPESPVRGHLLWEDGLSRDVVTLWDGAHDYGLEKGVTQYLALPSHTQGFFFVSVSSRLPGSYPDNELEMRLHMLTELSLLVLLHLEDEIVMPPEMKFSRHEPEILKWAAEERTLAKVAMILSISENTVNFYQKNMQRKSNTPNKAQIACYAVTIGLI